MKWPSIESSRWFILSDPTGSGSLKLPSSLSSQFFYLQVFRRRCWRVNLEPSVLKVDTSPILESLWCSATELQSFLLEWENNHIDCIMNIQSFLHSVEQAGRANRRKYAAPASTLCLCMVIACASLMRSKLCFLNSPDHEGRKHACTYVLGAQCWQVNNHAVMAAT